MAEPLNPFRGLVSGRVLTYFDEAFVEWGHGRIRGTYDYAFLAFNSTLYELKPGGKTLFEKLAALAADGRIDGRVLELARASEFLRKHERGITDMDLSTMSVADVQELLGFLERLYRSLQDRGVVLANDPRGVH